jgi:heme oxygenase
MSILDRLRDETRHLHQALENDLTVMRPNLQLTDYRRLLARFYGFYRPVEGALDEVTGLESTLPDWPQRCKLDSLANDLRALGFTGHQISELPVCVQLPAISGVEKALGCLYVLEGSTLGGQIIGRHLEAALHIGPDDGASFFCSYGSRVGAMWQTFQEVLRSREPADHERMIDAANQTFESIHRWLKEDIVHMLTRVDQPAKLREGRI